MVSWMETTQHCGHTVTTLYVYYVFKCYEVADAALQAGNEPIMLLTQHIHETPS